MNKNTNPTPAPVKRCKACGDALPASRSYWCSDRCFRDEDGERWED